jgi:hypothetical protein
MAENNVTINKEISEKDKEVLRKQLGREPEGAKEILVRDQFGDPRVVRVSPLVNGKPFGSFYWLSCPRLKKAIDHLEAGGLIQKIQSEILEKDDEFYEEFKKNHQKYIEDRLRYLELDGLNDQVQENMWASLKERGIGGVQNFRSIRCLHMHYAQHLVDKNIIGEYLDKNHNLNEV